MTGLAAFEEIIDASGIAPRIEAMLPTGVRARQLSVRTLLAERVLEVDPAPHRLGSVTVRQAKQELQHAHRRQLRRRDPGPPVPGIPAGEILVRPQAVEPVPHPHRRRPGRVASPRHPRGQLGNLDPQAGTNRHHALLRISRDSCPARLAPGVTAVSRIPRFPTESSLETISESADTGPGPKS